MEPGFWSQTLEVRNLGDTGNFTMLSVSLLPHLKSWMFQGEVVTLKRTQNLCSLLRVVYDSNTRDTGL